MLFMLFSCDGFMLSILFAKLQKPNQISFAGDGFVLGSSTAAQAGGARSLFAFEAVQHPASAVCLIKDPRRAPGPWDQGSTHCLPPSESRSRRASHQDPDLL